MHLYNVSDQMNAFDYFAGLAMQQAIIFFEAKNIRPEPELVADYACRMAKAMILAKERVAGPAVLDLKHEENDE